MPFQKKHKLGALPMGDEPLDDSPICFKARKGAKEKLTKIPGWRDKLRAYVEILIKESET